MEKRKKVDASMHSFVYFMLGVGVFANVMRFIIGSVGHFAYATHGGVRFPYEVLAHLVAAISLVMVFKCRGIGLLLFAGAQLIYGILANSFVLSLFAVVLLFLILQIKKNGVSAWELIMRGDIDGEDGHQ